MIHWSLLDKYNLIKDVCRNEFGISSVGIHNFGLLHDIADRLGMKGNSGGNLHSMWARITKIMRELIKAGYPIIESRIKTCSWSGRETWHACFEFKEIKQ